MGNSGGRVAWPGRNRKWPLGVGPQIRGEREAGERAQRREMAAAQIASLRAAKDGAAAAAEREREILAADKEQAAVLPQIRGEREAGERAQRREMAAAQTEGLRALKQTRAADEERARDILETGRAQAAVTAAVCPAGNWRR